MLPSKETFIKEKDKELLGKIIVAASKVDNLVTLDLIVNIICRSNNRKNKILDFRVKLHKTSRFKVTKRD